MNYNPNYYLGNMNNQYVPQMQPQSFIPQQPQMQVLNGKVVDSQDVVRATEVPIGGYGIFPKADLSEIYIKSWNNNGTTSVITFRPIVEEPKEESKENSLIDIILEKMNSLETKLDNLMSAGASSMLTKSAPAAKKEVKLSEY